MKRVVLLTLLAISIALPVHALSWAYAFVVYDGRVYEVLNMTIADSELGKVIGEVETAVDDETGRYYGNASNMYDIGTQYREVRGLSRSRVIAVEDDGVWLRAEYRHDARFHVRDLMDLLSYILLGMGVFGAGYTFVKWRRPH